MNCPHCGNTIVLVKDKPQGHAPSPEVSATDIIEIGELLASIFNRPKLFASLNEWEDGFVADLSARHKKKVRISEKQLITLRKIAEVDDSFDDDGEWK